MPNVMGREFPYTPEGMAAADQYRRTFGMRDGGMMGFRPIGMQEGGANFLGINPLVSTGMGRRVAIETIGAAGRRAPLTKPQKIQLLMALTGITDQRLYMSMSEEQIDNALQQLEAEAAAKEQDRRRRGDPTTWGEQPTWGEQSPQGQPDITAPLDRYPMDEALQQLETSAPMPPEPMPYFNPNDIEFNRSYTTDAKERFGPNSEIGAIANGGYITRNRNRGGIMSLRRR